MFMSLVVIGLAPFAIIVLLVCVPSFLLLLANADQVHSCLARLAAESAAQMNEEFKSSIRERGQLRLMQSTGGHGMWHRRRFVLAVDKFNGFHTAAEAVRSKAALIVYFLAAVVFFCASAYVCATRGTSFSGKNASSAGLLLCYTFMLLPHAITFGFSPAWATIKAQCVSFERLRDIVDTAESITQEPRWYMDTAGEVGQGGSMYGRVDKSPPSPPDRSRYAYTSWMNSVREQVSRRPSAVHDPEPYKY
jgi:ABC-type multidrug transport system fused ATPase/permease subunit